jgi:hypothetical protein
MSTVREDLPDDVETLKELVLSSRAEVEHLKLIIAKLKRLQFGRRSEKLDREIEQLELRLEELQTLGRSNCPEARASCWSGAGTPAAARSPAAQPHRTHARVRLSRLWHSHAQDRRRRLRGSRLRAGALPRDPARAAQARLPRV